MYLYIYIYIIYIYTYIMCVYTQIIFMLRSMVSCRFSLHLTPIPCKVASYEERCDMIILVVENCPFSSLIYLFTTVIFHGYVSLLTGTGYST